MENKQESAGANSHQSKAPLTAEDLPDLPPCFRSRANLGNPHEITVKELADYVHESGEDYSSEELRNKEIKVVKMLNNNLLSCDIDEFVYELGQYHEPFTELKRLYSELNLYKIYPGNLSYDDLFVYLTEEEF